ncbi:MAG: PIG-L family deacetylase [Chitinophagales bacterium]
MRKILVLLIVFISVNTYANQPSSKIFVDLQKLNSLKKVLYIAAHPDDENTRALAYFSLGEKAETAYLSLTRGDGGQNLIGDELSEDLGVLRTQELLAARSYDGAQQYFSKAVDFGYSKSAEETFEKWGKDEILADVVLMIRKFQPDVIITRFPPDERGGHGHHTASAVLAIEAFEKAADPNFLPDQVKMFGTWQTTSIYWNASNWWNKDLDKEAINNPEYLVKDIGGYNDLLGMSYNEIGTIARSQHKCQGFGAVVERGSRTEFFQYLAGEKLKEDFFEQNDKTWSKIINPQFEQKFNFLLKNFDFLKPENNVSRLLDLKKSMSKLPASTFKNDKIALLDRIILDCLGLYTDFNTDDYALVRGHEYKVTASFLNRSSLPVSVKSINGQAIDTILPQHQTVEETLTIKNRAKISNPYWLNHPFTNVFTVDDKANYLMAENFPSFTYLVEFSVNGEKVNAYFPVEYKWRDPSYGERRRAAISTPEFTVNFDQSSVILQPNQTKKIELEIHSFMDSLQDEIMIETPENWKVNITKIPVNLNKKQETIFASIELTATEGSKRGFLILKNAKGEILKSFTEITYDHIPTQVIFKDSKVETIKIDAKIKQGKIAYIKGVEDAVPKAIEQLGFDVQVFEVSDLSSLDLSPFQSVVLGIRIYNVHDELRNFDNKLFTYVENGGNLIMQYNTASRNSTDLKFGGPIPFELTRNRVTEEDAAVTFLAPEHPIMNYPNKITPTDFDNWVQERGLYFAGNWSEDYTPLFSWHDVDEDPQTGALIVAKHGKGQFVYTGISFFRELPNGVEGAYRLFANLLSYGE